MAKQKHSNGAVKKLVIAAYIAAAVFALAGAYLFVQGIASGSTVIIVAFWVALFALLLDKELKKKQADERNAQAGLVKVTNIASEYHGKDHRAVEKIFRNHGFRNVTCVNLQDLHVIMVSKPGTTQSVTIDGKEACVNEWYSPDAEVRVLYHGFAE